MADLLALPTPATGTALAAERGGSGPTVAIAVAAFLVVAVAATEAVHVAARGEQLVVRRFGRVRRVRGPGAVLAVPWLDRVTRVSLEPASLGPEPVDAHTRDGAAVRVHATARIQVVEPDAATAAPDVPARIADELAHAVRTAVAATDLAALTADPARLAGLVRDQAAPTVRHWGVEVLAVHITDRQMHLDHGAP